MTLRPLMILGCSSYAGKSLLATALIRWFVRQGIDVAPFKGQNMSNNARVVDGGEIGVAQWLQARAGGVEPTVDMNPILLKPEDDARSQVIVAGRARHDLTETPWGERGPHLWPAMEMAYRRLSSEHDLMIIEGAGSPAEINLDDLVNNEVLGLSGAEALLVVDIDRGGAFAHLYGTWALSPEPTRERMAGFILNRFRGDVSLLEPGPSNLTAMTSMHAIGVVPMLDHDLPDEEGAMIRDRAPADAPVVAIVRWPYASNLDEFHLLSSAAHVRWAITPADLQDVDIVILPGSKHVAADAAWLRKTGLDRAIVSHASTGGRTLGICGGAMILGREVIDPQGVEGATAGVGLLPLSTTMDPDKVTEKMTLSLSALPDEWATLNGIEATGYEIRNGRISGESIQISAQLWGSGSILATTVHGLLEDPAVLRSISGHGPEPILEKAFDMLADAVEEHLDTGFLLELVGL